MAPRAKAAMPITISTPNLCGCPIATVAAAAIGPSIAALASSGMAISVPVEISAATNMPTVAKDRHRIAERKHLVKVMRDEDDAHAGIPDPAHKLDVKVV